MIGAELMRDAALLGAECLVAVPPTRSPPPTRAGPHGRRRAPRCCAAARARAAPTTPPGCASATSSAWTRARTGSSCSAPPSSCTPRPRPPSACSPRTRACSCRRRRWSPGCCAAILEVPFAEALAAGARRRRGPPARARRGDRARRPACRTASTRCASCSRSWPPLHDDPAALGAHARAADRDGASRPPRPAFDPERVAPRRPPARAAAAARRPRALAPRRAPAGVRHRRPARAGRPTSSRSRRSCRGSPSCSRLRDGLLVLDLHALTAVAAGAARAPRSGLGPLVVLVDETADTGEHARGRRRRPSATPRRCASGRRSSATEPAHAMAARFRVGVEEARSAIREARDLRRTADGDAATARVDARGRRRADPGAGRAAHGPPRQRDRDVRPRSPTSSCPTTCGSSSTRSSPGTASQPRALEHGPRRRATALGTGLTCLFAGKSGTGKTFAARCLAGRARPQPLPHRPQPGRVEVHRRDREGAGAGLRRGRGGPRPAALRRGRRALRPPVRGQGRARPLRQHRGRLPAAAARVLRRDRRPDHEPAGQHGRRVRAAAAVHPPLPGARPRAAPPALGALAARAASGATTTSSSTRSPTASSSTAARSTTSAWRPRTSPPPPSRAGSRPRTSSAPPSASCRRPGGRPTPAAFGPLAELVDGNGARPVSSVRLRIDHVAVELTAELRVGRGRGDAAHGARAARARASPGRRSAPARTRRSGARAARARAGRARLARRPGRRGAPRRRALRADRRGRPRERRARLPARRVHRLRARRLSGPQARDPVPLQPGVALADGRRRGGRGRRRRRGRRAGRRGGARGRGERRRRERAR